MEMVPRIYKTNNSNWTARGKTDEWQVWEADPTAGWDAVQRGVDAANERVVNDWLAAIIQDRQPVCSGYAGMKALEMSMAVFAAGLARARVGFPLEDRHHPLEA